MERTTTSMILRAQQAYVGLLCEKQTLELGICYFSALFAELPEVNQYREIIASTTKQADDAIAEATGWFDQQALTCYTIAPANGIASNELRTCLESKGYVRQEDVVMVLARWESFDRPKTLRVLPARAVRQAYQTVVAAVHTSGSQAFRDQAVAAAVERLDSPQLDAFVALDAGQPVAYAGLFQVGDIALVTDVCVLPGVEAARARNALLSHILSLAKRLEVRNICYELPGIADSQLKTTLESWGFVCDGVIEEYKLIRPSCDEA